MLLTWQQQLNSPACMLKALILTIYFRIYFPMKRVENFIWHVSPGLIWTYLYSFTSVCIGYRVIVAMSDRIPPVQTVKQLPRPKKLTKIDTLIFSYANVNDYSQCDNVNFVKLWSIPLKIGLMKMRVRFDHELIREKWIYTQRLKLYAIYWQCARLNCVLISTGLVCTPENIMAPLLSSSQRYYKSARAENNNRKTRGKIFHYWIKLTVSMSSFHPSF